MSDNGWWRVSAVVFWAATALLAATWLAAAVEPACRIFRFIPVNYNEGWNAYWSYIAWHGEQLYPPTDSPLSNNYPPISFYVVGCLGYLLGDNIFAGRLLAFCGLLVIAADLWFWLRAVGCSLSVSSFGSVLFLAAFAHYASGYIAMDDPQVMAHAFIVTGAMVLWRYDFSRRAVIAGSLLMVLGGLTKHLLLPLPLAVTAWMALNRRHQLSLWLLTAIMALGIAIAAIWLAFGAAFFQDMASSRLYSRVLIESGTRRFWESLGFVLVLGCGVVLPYASRLSTRVLREYAELTVFYLAFAGAIGILAAGGKGVDRNAFFDLMIAAVLAVTTSIEYLSARAAHANAQYAVSSVATALVAAICCGYFARSTVASWPAQWREIRQTDAREAETLQVVRTIRSLGNGATACEHLALCYWAGNDFMVDFFNYGQKLATRALPSSDCERVFSPQNIQLVEAESPPGDPRVSVRLPRECNVAIQRSYSVAAKFSYGALLRPTRQALTASAD